MNGDDLERTLGRIEGKLGAVDEKVDGIVKRLDNYSKRLRALEVWRGFLAGAAAVLTALLGWIGWGK